MLAALGLKYDSEEAMVIIDRVMRTKMEAELDCTIDMALLRGTFKGWDSELEFGKIEISNKAVLGRTKVNLKYPNGEVYNADSKRVGNQFYETILLEFTIQAIRMSRFGRRNVSWSTVAPTGTVNKFAA